jgi:hypothetical protein
MSDTNNSFFASIQVALDPMVSAVERTTARITNPRADLVDDLLIFQ